MDFKALIVAGLIGAVLYTYVFPPPETTVQPTPVTTTLMYGFGIGAGVQIGVRLLGVS
jgi:hypothetical protein